MVWKRWLCDSWSDNNAIDDEVIQGDNNAIDDDVIQVDNNGVDYLPDESGADDELSDFEFVVAEHDANLEGDDEQFEPDILF